MRARLGAAAFYGWLALSTPLFAAIACLIAPLPPLARYRAISVWSRLAVLALRLCCGVRYRVLGASNIPPAPAVFLSRHESAWETIAYQAILPPHVFVLKKSLLRVPFFGWGLRQMSPIAINRANGRAALRSLQKQGRARLAAGFHVVVFPEGTRLAADERRRFFAGGAWLAKQNNVPAVPVAVNSGARWGKNSWRKSGGEITVAFGKPILPDGLSAEEINEKARAWIYAAQPQLATADSTLTE